MLSLLSPSTFTNIENPGEHLKREHHKSFDWKALSLFSSSQVDTKVIIDSKVFTQEEKWLYRRLGLRLYQCTAIFLSLSWHVTGQRTRARFISFSFQNTKRAFLNSLEYLFSHLDSHGATFEETNYLQTDWGAEYGGQQTKIVKRHHQEVNQLKLRRSPPFTHLHIRKGRSEDNGFIERSHRTDDEFYRLEKGGSRTSKTSCSTPPSASTITTTTALTMVWKGRALRKRHLISWSL